ncbi:MAG TPA: hypothetical protein VFD82_19300 [Planctomycetota bacterium]|nr:hypothetical protein [Planctomycetota bacterium]
MLTKSLIATCLGLLAATASAQSCATLTVAGTGAPGTSLTFNFDGQASGAFAFLAVGATQGTTSIPFGPLGTLTLGLDAPFLSLPLGMTNASGDVSLSVPVPNGFPASLDLFAQGVTAELTFTPPSPPTPPTIGLTFCTSNVAGFHIGA